MLASNFKIYYFKHVKTVTIILVVFKIKKIIEFIYAL
jgi:hypothetical protein